MAEQSFLTELKRRYVIRMARLYTIGACLLVQVAGALPWLWQPEAWARKARQDPSFQSFAKRMRIVEYWQRYGWPDLCKPAPDKGPDAFTCR